MISADGGCVAVTYTRLITHGEQTVAERRLLVLDDAGNTLWEKGGLLFSPTLVSVAADGHRVTVSDGQQHALSTSTMRAASPPLTASPARSAPPSAPPTAAGCWSTPATAC